MTKQTSLFGTEIYPQVLQFKRNIERNNSGGDRDDKYSIDTIQNNVVTHVKDEELEEPISYRLIDI